MYVEIFVSHKNNYIHKLSMLYIIYVLRKLEQIQLRQISHTHITVTFKRVPMKAGIERNGMEPIRTHLFRNCLFFVLNLFGLVFT